MTGDVLLDSDRKPRNVRSDLYVATRATPDEAFVIEELATLDADVANESEPQLLPDLSELVFVWQGDLWISTLLQPSRAPQRAVAQPARRAGPPRGARRACVCRNVRPPWPVDRTARPRASSTYPST